MVLQKFGARVKELRNAKGWSQERFAFECGLDRTYISGLEKGRRNVSLKNIAKICKCLGISLRDFFDFKMYNKGPFNGLQTFFGKSLVEKAVELDYSLDNILILKGKMEELKAQYPRIYANIYSCDHNRDKRTPEEYAKDLVASWLFEDYIFYSIQNSSLDIQLNGADKNRQILSTNDVKSDPDFNLIHKGVSVRIELATDYYNYWNTYKKIDLRDFKYEDLKISKALLLGVSILDKTFFIIDFRKDNIRATFNKEYKPFGNKAAYSIDLNQCNIKFHKFSESNMIQELLKII